MPYLRNRLGAPAASVAASIVAMLAAQGAPAQTSTAPDADGPVVRGLYNWVHTTGDAETAFAFYRDVFGIELAPFPFGGDPDAKPEAIRPADQARSDALVWNLTDTEGSRFRTVFMRASNTSFGLELSEFFDIPRNERPANPWDPGASMLVFEVTELDAVLRRLEARGAEIVTTGGLPIATAAGRSLLVRDPDGYLVRVTESSAVSAGPDLSDSLVVGTSIAITVASTDRALAFYRDLLGFAIGTAPRADRGEVRLYGLSAGGVERTPMHIPDTDIRVTLLDFSTEPDVVVTPFAWRIQDVGAPQFQLQVAGLDRLLARTHAAGFRFLSVGAQPIDRPFGRFVFAIDPDGVLVEFVEPAE